MKKMKILISADMEGISGVVAWEQVFPGGGDYERFRRVMTAEMNAAIEGALAGGATDILVNDGHSSMTNIIIEELHPAAQLVSGSPNPFGPMQGISSDLDKIFLVGAHSAAGTRASVLAHTWSRIIVEVRLNDRPIGEVGLNAALAGAFGKPVVLVTGDKAVTDEARALLGNIETVAVKESITGSAAQCFHPKVSESYILEAARRALTLNTKLFTIQAPITICVGFQNTIQADMAEMIPGCNRIDGRTINWTGEDMSAVYQTFQAMVALGKTQH